MNKVILTIIILLTSESFLLSQTNLNNVSKADSSDDFYYRGNYFGAGVRLGLTSGTGLTGRFVSEKGFVIGASVFAITLGDWTHFNFGAEGQYSFIREKDSRYYATLGLAYFNSTTDEVGYPGNRIANPFRIGLGIGYEWFLNKRFATSFALPITYFPSTSQILPLPEISLQMYFK
ncbi:MAG: hypothetical protein IPP08_07955 [Chlorobiota bacterium]|jgi:hypothetical protein|nr:MAG: hypothetical protein IPP08_07955 [Chlorobiota bacterium]